MEVIAWGVNEDDDGEVARRAFNTNTSTYSVQRILLKGCDMLIKMSSHVADTGLARL